jgi:hypothetical protein
MPTYDWLRGSIEALSNDDLREQYAQYCAERGIQAPKNPLMEETAF